MNITDLISRSLEYYDSNNEKYKDKFEHVRYTKFKFSNIDIEYSMIYLYDDNKKEIYKSRIELIGVFLTNSNIWTWGWAIPTLQKNLTTIIRKIWNYGAELNNELNYLKMELITSRFKISDVIQLDMHISIAAYLSKKPLIYKYYKYINIDNFNNDTDVFIDNQKTSDQYNIYYIFLLDI